MSAQNTANFSVLGTQAAAPSGPPGLVTLYAPDPSAVPSVVLLPPTSLVLGRSVGAADVALPFPSVSRVHASISRDGTEIVVDDRESRNGTFVNGVSVRHARVVDGDQIRIGDVVFKVVAADADAFIDMPLHGVLPEPPLDRLRGGVSMDRVRREIARTANAPLSVLVLGETGTGKELVARALHDTSGRRGRFATVNCAAIPATLLESELFGFKRGAFTGADRDRIGLVKSADGGTLFLDEIGDMALDAQAKLLRMLETRTVTPLGSHTAEPVDVRIVCATHRPLAQFVREERFRADLFARINGHTIALPPLRERKEDLFQLAHFFLEQAGGAHLEVTPAFMIGLLEHDWPFNVREVQTAMTRAVALASTVLDRTHLPPTVTDPARGESGPRLDSAIRQTAPPEDVLKTLLQRHEGNVSAVARELRKDRVQVHRWLKRYGISLDEFRAS